jgi:hypothetical protein
MGGGEGWLDGVFGRRYTMLFRFKPEIILNPSVTVAFFGIFAWLYFDRLPLIVVGAGSLLFGLYVGSAWRGASELWEKRCWSFFKDGEWHNAKARDWQQLRYKVLASWVIVSALRIVFLAFAFVVLGFGFGVSFDLVNGELALWMSIPATFFISGVSVFIAMGPYLVFQDWARRGKSVFGKMAFLLSQYKSLVD